MAATPVFPFIFSSSSYHPSPPMLMLVFCIFFILLSLFILVLSLYTFKNNNNHHKNLQRKEEQYQETTSLPVDDVDIDSDNMQQLKQERACESDSAHLTRSLLLEILPSDSSKWDTLFSGETENCGDPDDKKGPGQEEKKRKMKRAKKKRPDPDGEEKKDMDELVCLYPFTKSSSAAQRKIKQHYDQLVKSHESNALNLAQVGQFVTCLVEARNQLQHKSEVIKRKFTITKALLSKADRSSFDRLCQQISKLELEQKRLEEDAFVYNWLQQQLKLSPAYKKMLELGACMDMKAKSAKLVENTDTDDFCDISFEELLAKEKKDVFWQRNGRFKPCSS